MCDLVDERRRIILWAVDDGAVYHAEYGADQDECAERVVFDDNAVFSAPQRVRDDALDSFLEALDLTARFRMHDPLDEDAAERVVDLVVVQQRADECPYDATKRDRVLSGNWAGRES